jgi:2-polyprenyl-6-methoxyphenol hydroxylase-like FAD-dependent oxidoreductase
MMLGWLLARAGVDVVVLEKHADFFRDFRGDTLHPSTLEVVDELGALDRLLAVPHTRVDGFSINLLGKRAPGPDFTHLGTPVPYLALMPQWDFLDFVRREASRYPTFHLEMEVRATELVREGDRVVGLRAETPRGPLEVRSRLVVAADGRHSDLRRASGLPAKEIGTPVDVLWFRVPRRAEDGAQALAIVTADRFLVAFDRRDYWQCAFLVRKGSLDALKARGLAAFRNDVRALVPVLGDRVEAIGSWDDVKLLTVVVDRLEKWWLPGLLCIGDAAHAMSPVGGVGINLAIQDAVAAANLLSEPLLRGTPTPAELAAVQDRRARPTEQTQALQLRIHRLVLEPVIAGRAGFRLRVLRLVLSTFPGIGRWMARTVGLGYRQEHVGSPTTGPTPG